MIGHNAGEGIEPRNNHRCIRAKGFMSWKPVLLQAFGQVCGGSRGLSPWQVIERLASEPGRAVPFPKEASNELKRRSGSMAVRQSDSPIVEG